MATESQYLFHLWVLKRVKPRKGKVKQYRLPKEVVCDIVRDMIPFTHKYEETDDNV